MPDNDHPEMVCAVCGRVLAHTDRGYTHMLRRDFDHIAVPVPGTEMRPTYRCDFCSADDPTWSYDARTFVGPHNIGSVTGWAACDICHGAIESNQWNRLAVRSLHTADIPQPTPEIRARLLHDIKALHRQFRKNRIGPARHLEGGEAL